MATGSEVKKKNEVSSGCGVVITGVEREQQVSVCNLLKSCPAMASEIFTPTPVLSKEHTTCSDYEEQRGKEEDRLKELQSLSVFVRFLP